jgi:hypothetical protein
MAVLSVHYSLLEQLLGKLRNGLKNLDNIRQPTLCMDQ